MARESLLKFLKIATLAFTDDDETEAALNAHCWPNSASIAEAGTFGECWRFSPNIMFGNARKLSRTSFLLSLLLTIRKLKTAYSVLYPIKPYKLTNNEQLH